MGYLVLGGMSMMLLYYMFQRKTMSLDEQLALQEKSPSVSELKTYEIGPFSINSGPDRITIGVKDGQFPQVVTAWNQDEETILDTDLPLLDVYDDLMIHGQDKRWLLAFDFDVLHLIKRFKQVSLGPDGYTFEGEIKEADEARALTIARRFHDTDLSKLVFSRLPREDDVGMLALELVGKYYPMADSQNRATFFEAVASVPFYRRLTLATALDIPERDMMIPLVFTQHPDAVEAAKYLLGACEEDEVKHMCRELLGNTSVTGGVLSIAMEWMAAYPEDAEIGALLDNLATRKDSYMNEKAVSLFEMLGDSKAEPFLLAQLAQDKEEAVPAILDALARCGGRSSVEPLADLRDRQKGPLAKHASRTIEMIQDRLGDAGWLTLTDHGEAGQLSLSNQGLSGQLSLEGES